ncbi:MAG: DUF2341 domain-containing protein, partial [Desulfuromonadales bacterium]|nr:DUF2341 domain-containing protein [Desulfuromonadales bacterium]
WDLKSATTTLPPAPSGIEATAINTTQIDIIWTDNSGSETGYRLQRCTGSGCTFDPDPAVESELLAPSTESYSDTTVVQGQTYSYQVRAEKDDGPIWNTTWVGTTTATTVAKKTPNGLNASHSSEVQINLSWLDSNDDETGFKVERCAGSGCSNFTQIDMVKGNGASVEQITYADLDNGLAPGAEYSYQVRAYKTATNSWDSDYSNIVSATTSVIAPSSLTANAANTTTIDLDWVDNADTETGTEIWRCQGAGCSSYAKIDITGDGATSYIDTTVANNTSYSYQLVARDDGLSNNGGGLWTYRAPLNFSSYNDYQNYEITVVHAAGMRNDFGDLRFYDEIALQQLPYWIKAKTDGVSATVLFRTRFSDSISMYYGNPNATDDGHENALLDVYTFAGTVIDTNQWTEIDPSNGISQDNDLLLNDVTQAWSMALISETTYP